MAGIVGYHSCCNGEHWRILEAHSYGEIVCGYLCKRGFGRLLGGSCREEGFYLPAPIILRRSLMYIVRVEGSEGSCRPDGGIGSRGASDGGYGCRRGRVGYALQYLRHAVGGAKAADEALQRNPLYGDTCLAEALLERLRLSADGHDVAGGYGEEVVGIVHLVIVVDGDNLHAAVLN